jgi:predicted phage tail protein
MGQKPKNDADKENEKSFIFSGVSNTAEIGQRIYVVYGVMLAPSMVLSATVRSYITATNVGGS